MKTAASLQFSEDGRLVANFTPESMKRVRQGQTAMLIIDAGTDQPTESLPAMVFDTQADSNAAEILVKSDEIPESLKTGNLSGHVEVEVEYATPAQLLFRVSGKYFGGNNIVVSPQTTEPVSQDGQ